MSFIKDVKIFDFDFAVEVAGTEISTYGARYLSVLTDGAFNPDANKTVTIKPGRLYLQFDNGEHKLLHDEFRNYYIGERKSIKIYNIADTPVSSILSNGYRYFYIVLHKYPLFEQLINKCPPSWCWTGNIANGNSEAFVFGSFNVMAGVNIGLPYLPPGYCRVRSKIECSTPADGQYTLENYHSCTLLSPTQVYLVTGADVQRSDDVFTNRIHLLVENRGAASRTFYCSLTWLRNQA